MSLADTHGYFKRMGVWFGHIVSRLFFWQVGAKRIHPNNAVNGRGCCVTTYRVELQMPYGTLVAVYEGENRTLAAHRYLQFLQAGKGKAFIPCFVNGKEVAPSRMRRMRIGEKK